MGFINGLHNQYDLPLLDIMGLALTGWSCFIAFAFIRDGKAGSCSGVFHRHIAR